MNDIQLLIDELVKFRDARHREQFHNTKDLALAISIEAAELNELFLWKTTEESELKKHKELENQ
jgi:NTP pyrophosphatase (non-canonical NTP hydrolase)